jgi:hypothetical protein
VRTAIRRRWWCVGGRSMGQDQAVLSCGSSRRAGPLLFSLRDPLCRSAAGEGQTHLTPGMAVSCGPSRGNSHLHTRRTTKHHPPPRHCPPLPSPMLPAAVADIPKRYNQRNVLRSSRAQSALAGRISGPLSSIIRTQPTGCVSRGLPKDGAFQTQSYT